MKQTRRRFLKNITLTVPQIYLMSSIPGCTSSIDVYYSKAMGCFMGAAIGDAMGGPIEGQHYKRIQKYAGEMNGLLEYKKPAMVKPDLHPGYAQHPEPGSITDDTYIRMDLTKYLLAPDADFTAEQFAAWLIKNADFSNWWKAAVGILKEVEKGTYTAEEAGLHHKQGGGGGWWQPLAILFAGDIEKTVKAVDSMCRIWKAPLERNILTAVCAGQAAAMKEGSTIDSVVDTVFEYSGPLATKLFDRAVDIAKNSNSREDLFKNLYSKARVDRHGVTTDIDGPVPAPDGPVEYMEGRYSSTTFAEQQPWALAYFVWGKGDPYRTVVTAAMGGRDADSIATNTAAWLGAMSGIEVWPEEWVRQVQQANLVDFDLKQTCEDLILKSKKL